MRPFTLMHAKNRVIDVKRTLSDKELVSAARLLIHSFRFHSYPLSNHVPDNMRPLETTSNEKSNGDSHRASLFTSHPPYLEQI